MAAVCRTSLKASRRTRISTAHGLQRSALCPVAWAVAIAFPVMGGMPALAAQYGPSVPSVVSAQIPVRTQLPVPVGDVTRGQVYNQTTNSGNRQQWLQYGSSSLVESGATQNIYQGSQRGIYNWQSFNVGADATVNFFFSQANSSALNRVPNAVNPSVIMGHINSYIGNTITSPIGGDVYIMNGAGVLFGRGSQVNVGGLIASTLDVNDADYLSGFGNSLTSAAPTFKWEGTTGISTFDHPSNYVQVDPEAEITTASGGRVYLLAKRVENNGTIRTSDKGQTVLASGSEVYLQDPGADKMYASEASTTSTVAALNGFLVEVGGNGNGTNAGATNNGLIEAIRGNVTIVGMAVNQNGRIRATTSVADRGSVFLLARGGATGAVNGTDITKRATQGGALTLGPGSTIAIAPQLTYTNGVVDKVDGNGYFTRSRVELSGRTIEMKDDAQIVAPGAIVNALAFANAAPTVGDSAVKQYVDATAVQQTDARIVMGAGASIDVSGANTAQASVADFFVTVRRAGVNELKDAPLQKSGILYHEKLVFDARNTTPIIGDTSTYINGIGRTADNWLASGGSVTMATDGAVLTHATSTVNVSGGQVAYAGAMVSPTVVVASNGARYTLSTAPTDLRYVAVAAASKPTNTRFGPSPQAAAGSDTYFEQGYVEGKSAGSFTVVAPTAVLDGTLKANASAGRRQLAGLDAMAKGGTLKLGMTDEGTSVAVMRDLVIAEGHALSDDNWMTPLTTALPDRSQISASMLSQSGVGTVKAYVDGSIVQQKGADLNLSEKAGVDLRASGSGGIELNGNIVARGGSVRAVASLNKDNSVTGGPLVVGADSTIDVSGTWVNRSSGDVAHKAALAGGSVTLRSARDVTLSAGSVIDVSGGATLNAAGTKASHTNAGSITLSAGESGSTASAGKLTMGGELLGYSGAKGGTLSVATNSIQVRAGNVASETGADGTLTLGSDFFTGNGFASYAVDGRTTLTVQDGAVVAPRTQSWVLNEQAAGVATDARPASAMVATDLPLALRTPTNLALKSSGSSAPNGTVVGDLTVAQGARIDAEAGSTVSLTAGRNLTVDGRITAQGGTVSLKQVRAIDTPTTIGALNLGSSAVIDVSGTTLLRPASNGVQRGTVLAGGTINVEGAKSSGQTINLKAGSALIANGTVGTVGTVDIDRPLGAASNTAMQRTTLATQGGNVNVTVGGGGAVLASGMQAQGGNASVADGTFALTAYATGGGAQVTVQDVPVGDVAPVAGQTVVSAQMLSKQFDTVSIKAAGSSGGKVKFTSASTPSSVTLAVGKALTIDTAAIQTDAKNVTLSAGSVLYVGNSAGAIAAPAATAGTSTLALKGPLIELQGNQTLQGVGTLTAEAGRELRLVGAGNNNGSEVGTLNTQADIRFTAPQVTAATHATYTINAPGHRFVIDGGDRSLPKPLSAGASLTINAADIVQDGVLLVPFGQITFNATNSLTLGANSLTSVSGAGLTVPYGYIEDGLWKYNGLNASETLSQLREKSITLNAPGQSMTSEAGSLLDLSGGGELVASQFVPGAGGSSDIFAGSSNGSFAIIPNETGFAPTDSYIAGLADGSGAKTTVQLGQQITFGEGGPVPAGTYTILPARYALLAGAYLIQPSSKVNLAQGFALKQQDGSYLVGATRSVAGTSFADAQPTTYRVLSSDLARTYSEVQSTTANSYFTALAAKNDQAVSRLPQDAGTLNVAAARLTLAGQALFNLPNAVSRGGEANFAGNVHVGDTPLASGDAMELTVAQLRNIGAQSVLLGGSRSQSSTGERVVTTSASKVVIDSGTQLSAGDIILTATDLIDIQSGASITATGGAAAQSVSLSNNGASLRVSTDADAGVTRSYSTDSSGYLLGANNQRLLVNGQPVKAGDSGTLNIGNNVVISGPAISAEVSKSLNVANSATLKATDSFTLGARRFAVGDTSGVSAAELNGAQVLGAGLAQTLQNSQRVTLKATDAVDLYANAKIGGDAQRALTIDTQQIAVKGSGTAASIEAGDVTLTNTSGKSISAAPQMVGKGSSLTVEATGAAGGSGRLTLGPGAVALNGADSVALKASTDVVTNGASVQADGNVAVTAQRVMAAKATDSALAVAGKLTIAGNGNQAATTTQTTAAAGAGASLQLSAATIQQGGKIELPSGSLTLKSNASGLAQDAQAITFAAGSVTDLSGRSTTIDSQVINAQGGQLLAQATTGAITVAAADANAGAALIDVSGARASASATTTGAAGSVTLSAPKGLVVLDGRVVGLSSAGQTGGKLNVDSLNAVDLNKLSAALAAEQSGALGNFTGALALRNRQGSQTLSAGTQLKSQQISLVADAGALTVAGQLDASGSSGGQITLAAGQNLTVADGALLDAHATQAGHDGGQVMLSSSAGRISLQGGDIVTSGGGDLAAGQTRTGETGADGSVLLRAQRQADGKGVLIDAIKTRITGARSVAVDAVKTYQVADASANSFDTALQTGLKDAATFGAKANTDQIVAALTASQGALASKLMLRSDIELRSSGDMTVGQTVDVGSSGAPVSLTLRSQGDLNVQAGISNGFRGDEPVAASGAVRLVAGGDLSSADVLATLPAPAAGSAGNVTIDGVAVRTTTGNLDVAAAHDVSFSNGGAVYTTGLGVTDLEAFDIGNMMDSSMVSRANLFLSGGGMVRVRAGNDVVANASSASANGLSWWYVDALPFTQESLPQATWWTEYVKFTDGVGAFGGGGAAVSAGRDIVKLNVATTESGYIAPDYDTTDPNRAAPVTQRFGGGQITVAAGRDVLGGMVFSGGGAASVQARDVGASADQQAFQAVYTNTQFDLSAQRNVTLGDVQAAGWMPDPYFSGYHVSGMSVGSSLHAMAAGGDLAYHASLASDAFQSVVLPNSVDFLAPAGSVSVGNLLQTPADAGHFSALAGDSLTISDKNLFKSWVATEQRPQLSSISAYGQIGSVSSGDQTDSTTRLVAATGDITELSGQIDTANPLHMIAGHDIVGISQVRARNNKADDLTLIQAGRDIKGVGGQGEFVTVDGPGDLVVVAGRNVELGDSDGIAAIGNSRYTDLPRTSAAVTVLAGVSLADGSTDYATAHARYFELLGGAGVADHAGDLAAQLAALQSGQSVPGIGSLTATQFDALSGSAQLQQASALVGANVYQQAVLTFMRNHDAAPNMSAGEALVRVAQLSSLDQKALAGQALAAAWTATMPQATQRATALTLAGAAGNPYAGALQSFMAIHGGSVLTTAAANDTDSLWARFSALAPEKQLLFTNQVLNAELAAAGKAGSQLKGDEQLAAYARGYNALATVFPGSKSGGEVLMTSSQIKTTQNSPIEIIIPHSGIDVGAPVSNARTGKQIGIVTAGGGSINMIVRDNLEVNTSRVFTVGKGDLLMWSSNGDIDGGKGARTVIGAPPPRTYFDPGKQSFVVDTSGSYSGSGIAALDASSELLLFAPRGEIIAGDAGIRASGTAYLGGTIRDAGGLEGGAAAAAPAPVAQVNAAANVQPPAATSAGQRDAEDKQGEDSRKKKKRNVLLDFLGFGSDADDIKP